MALRRPSAFSRAARGARQRPLERVGQETKPGGTSRNADSAVTAASRLAGRMWRLLLCDSWAAPLEVIWPACLRLDCRIAPSSRHSAAAPLISRGACGNLEVCITPRPRPRPSPRSLSSDPPPPPSPLPSRKRVVLVCGARHQCYRAAADVHIFHELFRECPSSAIPAGKAVQGARLASDKVGRRGGLKGPAGRSRSAFPGTRTGFAWHF